MDAPQSLRIAPEGEVDSRDLALGCLREGEAVAAWVETDGMEEWVRWRAIDGGKAEPAHILRPSYGSPTGFCLAGDCLFWVEMKDGAGRIHQAILDSPDGSCEPRSLMPEMNVGDVAAAVDASRRLWLAAQVWDHGQAGIVLWRLEDDVWQEVLSEPVDETPGTFCARPRLAAVGSTVLLSFDAYLDDTCRIVVCRVPDGDSSPGRWTLPAPEGCRETLSDLAVADDGAVYAARCRELLVELDDGIAAWRSELVVACLTCGADVFEDIAAVEIDGQMNPWMAPYVGRRRFPALVPGAEGVFLLWEEQREFREEGDTPAWLHPEGRCCALCVGPHGATGEALVAVDRAAMCIVESGIRGERVRIASRPFPEPFSRRLPWFVHTVDLSQATARRPSSRSPVADAPSFSVRPVPTDHALMELDGTRYCLFFGDLHLHSRLSQDLDGEMDELLHFARDVAHLDFASLSENDGHWFTHHPLPEADWESILRVHNFLDEPGQFTALNGYEYTHMGSQMEGVEPSGHRSVLYPGDRGKIHSWMDPATRDGPSLARRLHGTRSLAHHHQGGVLDLTDPSIERNIEVVSGWSAFIENEAFRERLHDLLRRGHHLGFLAASDNHERNPGLGGALTGVWATENTREGIFEALWSRRIFATTGLRPDLRFSINDAFMGGEAKVEAFPLVEVSVRCDVPVVRVEIVRDGEIVHVRGASGTDVSFFWEDSQCRPGRHFYYAHVTFEGSEYNPRWNIANAYGVNAYTSPVYVDLMWRTVDL